MFVGLLSNDLKIEQGLHLQFMTMHGVIMMVDIFGAQSVQVIR
jgi:hypothetical protein